MKRIEEGRFTGERALFSERALALYDCVFYDGESPLKESSDIELYGCIFKWKYPLWYSRNIKAEETTLLETARSGIWYTKDIQMKNCTIDAPKTFRRSEGIRLSNVSFSFAQETLWSCSDIELKDVSVKGDYFGLNCTRVNADSLSISGNYAFDGGRDIVIRNSRLISKDAFWNCENVTVYNSLIVGEYLGWNSKNVTFVDCTIESNQGMCYMDGVVMRNCKLINTDLAFEYSSVDADISSEILSVKNVSSGKVKARSIGEIIMQSERVDTSLTEIILTDK